MQKTKSHRLYKNGDFQEEPLEPDLLENILLEIGEIVGIKSPLDCAKTITYLIDKGYTNKQELRQLNIDLFC